MTYADVCAQIDANTRAMLDLFLNAGIQPDIIIVENEADSGMLFQYLDANGNMALRDSSFSGPYTTVASGHYTCYPKFAGFFKAVILAAKDEITKKGFNQQYTRFSVHTTSNPFRDDTMFGLVFGSTDNVLNGTKPDRDQYYYDSNGVKGQLMTMIPDNIRNANLRDLVDIMGTSLYPSSPAGNTQADFDATFSQINSDMASWVSRINAYGKRTSGPFSGDYVKQFLIVEYATRTNSTFTVPVQQAHTTYFFNQLAQYPWALGAMWWEPTYAHNNWYGGDGSLYRAQAWDATLQDWPIFNPIQTLTTWGSFGDLHLEAESLSVGAQSSGVTVRVFADTNLYGNSGSILDGTAVGNYVTYTGINLPQAGTYDIKVRVKKFNTRGIFQFACAPSLNGAYANHGNPVDLYVAGTNGEYDLIDIGPTQFGTSGSKAFRFTVTGKNASSGGYTLAFDYLEITRVE